MRVDHGPSAARTARAAPAGGGVTIIRYGRGVRWRALPAARQGSSASTVEVALTLSPTCASGREPGGR